MKKKIITTQLLCTLNIMMVLSCALQGLMLSYCSKIVHYWRKLSQQRNRNRKQSSLAVEHFTRNIFRRVFNALHEARQMMSTTSDAVAKLHDSSLKKKALKGLSDPDKIYREHHHKHSLARVFRVLQHNLDGYGSSDIMDNTVVKLYGTSLKKQALHRLASHLAYRRSKVAKEKLSLAHWRRSTEGKVLRNWVLFSRDHASKIRQQEQLHEIQLRKLLIASLKAWYQHTRDLREEGRYKSGQAAELWNRLSNLQTGRVWKAWIAIQKEKNMRALKKTQASNMHRGVKTAAATSAWRNYVMEKEIERGRLSEAQSYWKQQALKSAMQTWQIYLEAQRAKHDALLRASEHLKRVLKQKSMNSWKPWYKRQITKEINLQHAANMYRSDSSFDWQTADLWTSVVKKPTLIHQFRKLKVSLRSEYKFTTMMNGKVQEKKLCQTRKKKLLSFILITFLNLTNNCEGRPLVR